MAIGRKYRRALWTGLRLTSAGWVVLAIAVLVGLAAGQSQAAMLFVFFGVMMGALCASGVLAWRMVSAVQVRRDLPDRAWQNQTIHLAYNLRNVRRRGACLDLKIEEVAPPQVQSAGGYCVELPAKGAFRAGGRFTVRRRGRIDLQAVRVSTIFPFGLLSAARLTAAPASLVVWPALGRLKRRLLLGGATEISSVVPSGASGGQDEFFGLREYRDGDNPRWIHWRRSATKTTPVIREMARPVPESLWIILDTYCRDATGRALQTREKLLRFAATLVDHAFLRGYQVGLALAYADAVRTVPPAEGRAQRSALLDCLADVDVNTSKPLAHTIGALHRGQLRQRQVVIVTPEADRLNGVPLNAFGAASRGLSVITERELNDVFEDDPLAATEEGDAA